MSQIGASISQDNDTLHVLPLRIVPLQTKALQDAKLTKNTRLEGVVQLFSDTATGSGQLLPSELDQHFDLSGDRRRDRDVVVALGSLPSYDVYSLRIELRELGIDVDQSKHLRLSKEMERQLSGYMKTFTRPLMTAVYGTDDAEDCDFSKLVAMVANPDVGEARKNLIALARVLEVELISIPQFLMRYGDVYLSLAYYAYCMDRIRPELQSFLNVVEELMQDTRLQRERALMSACSLIKRRIEAADLGITHVLESFRVQTESMWLSISGARFKLMEKLILEYQKEIGGAICALTVKMNGWEALRGKRQLANRASFILSDMVQGMDQLRPIEFRASPG